MIKFLILLAIVFVIIIIHIFCGLICMHQLLNNPKSFNLGDLILLSIVGPYIILVWIVSDFCCWCYSKFKKKKKNAV